MVRFHRSRALARDGSGNRERCRSTSSWRRARAPSPGSAAGKPSMSELPELGAHERSGASSLRPCRRWKAGVDTRPVVKTLKRADYHNGRVRSRPSGAVDRAIARRLEAVDIPQFTHVGPNANRSQRSESISDGGLDGFSISFDGGYSRAEHPACYGPVRGLRSGLPIR